MKKQKLKFLLMMTCTALVVTSLLSCVDTDNVDIQEKVDNAKYDENNFTFNTIKLWGSEAAVIDEGDYYIFQGDIFINKEDLLAYETRGAGRLDRRWPDNIIHYSFADVPDNYTTYLYAAMAEIERNSYLTFTPRTNQSDYISINYKNSTTWTANSDFIGKKGGKQNINLSTNAIQIKGTIIHELCHAIGLYHEQCRADRDKYVNIDFSTMNDSEKYQFKTYTELGHSGLDIGTFDFISIMLYDSWMNGRYVMTKKDGSYFNSQRLGLSLGDVAALVKIQGAEKYGFYDPIGHNPPVDSPYEYIRSKYLRCPEETKVRFRFQHKYNVAASVLGGFSLTDFDLKAVVNIVDNRANRVVYSKEIPITYTSTYKDLYLPEIVVPQGFYTTKLTLKGVVNGQSSASKLSVLQRLMYNPLLYLHLDNVVINGNNVLIPSSTSYPVNERRTTFIDL